MVKIPGGFQEFRFLAPLLFRTKGSTEPFTAYPIGAAFVTELGAIAANGTALSLLVNGVATRARACDQGDALVQVIASEAEFPFAVLHAGHPGQASLQCRMDGGTICRTGQPNHSDGLWGDSLGLKQAIQGVGKFGAEPLRVPVKWAGGSALGFVKDFLTGPGQGKTGAASAALNGQTGDVVFRVDGATLLHRTLTHTIANSGAGGIVRAANS